RDSVVLDADVLAEAVGQDVAEVRDGQLPADVLVELAVVVVAGVARLRAPDLARRLHVASEEHHPARREDRRSHAVARAWMRVGDAVGLQEGELDARLRYEALLSRHVAALGQPDALRRTLEVRAVVLGRHLH